MLGAGLVHKLDRIVTEQAVDDLPSDNHLSSTCYATYREARLRLFAKWPTQCCTAPRFIYSPGTAFTTPIKFGGVLADIIRVQIDVEARDQIAFKFEDIAKSTARGLAGGP